VKPDPIDEATGLAGALAEALRVAAAQHGTDDAGARYAEALARTLLDLLVSMRRGRPAA
jgi:hypothetical protein